RNAVSESGGDVRGARSGGGRAQDQRAQSDRRLAADEPQHDADERQNTRAAEGIARSNARRAQTETRNCTAERMIWQSRSTTAPARPMGGACIARSSTKGCP